MLDISIINSVSKVKLSSEEKYRLYQHIMVS